jgi:hypothetical protein
MLKMWLFVLMIDGQPLEAFPADSEGHCEQIMARMLMVHRLKGEKPSGACYARTVAIDQSNNRYTGDLFKNR